MAVDLNPFDPLPTSHVSVAAVTLVYLVLTAEHDALIPRAAVVAGSASGDAAEAQRNPALAAADLALVSVVAIRSASAVETQHSLFPVILPSVASLRVGALLSEVASLETSFAVAS